MREDQRDEELWRLDEDMKYFRLAAKRKVKGWGDRSLLRRIRTGLGIPVTEIVDKLDMNRSVLGRLEESEARRTITLESLDRVAGAMGCRVVYGIVPASGEKMAEIGERRRLVKRMREEGIGNIGDECRCLRYDNALLKRSTS